MVGPAGGHQLLVGTALGDTSVFHQKDHVGAPDGRQAMRDHEGGAAGQERGHGRLNQLLAFRVQVARRFVEDEDLRRCQPRSPIDVSYRSGSLTMNSWALARRAASSISASVASRRPYAMFSRTEPSNKNTSCWTMASRSRYVRRRKSLMAMPLRRMRPLVGSWNRATRSVTVVFPAPLRPTRATTEPPGTVTAKSRTTGWPSR